MATHRRILYVNSRDRLEGTGADTYTIRMPVGAFPSLLPGQQMTVSLIRLTIPVIGAVADKVGPLVTVYTSMPLNVLSTSSQGFSPILATFSTYAYGQDLEIQGSTMSLTGTTAKLAIAYENPDPASTTVNIWGRGIPDTVRFWVTFSDEAGVESKLPADAEWQMVLAFDVMDTFATDKTHNLLAGIHQTMQLQLLRDHFFLGESQIEQQRQNGSGAPSQPGADRPAPV